jgi:hypothetical protein
MKKCLLFLLAILALSCKTKPVAPAHTPAALPYQNTALPNLQNLPDSIKAGDIVIYNIFKNQVLAHAGGSYDSLMVINKVYRMHKPLWDDCYALIFGDENAPKFNTAHGMAEWNKMLYPDNREFFDQRINTLLQLDVETMFRKNLERFNSMVPYKPSARISIAFTPFQGIGFGGCGFDKFVFELNNTDFDVAFTLQKGIAHELNHLAYEPFRNKDPHGNTALAQTIDEGFACYFTWVFFDYKDPKELMVEEMTQAEWDWYMAHEKEIYTLCRPYFYDTSGESPLLDFRQQLFPDAPRSLNYWLGFRIVECYVNKHGKDSWKNLYTTPIATILKDSGYEEYINSL